MGHGACDDVASTVLQSLPSGVCLGGQPAHEPQARGQRGVSGQRQRHAVAAGGGVTGGGAASGGVPGGGGGVAVHGECPRGVCTV